MTKAITTHNQITFNPEARALIKKTVADGLTDLEFDMFVYQAQRTGLDPMARQIYAIKRAGKTVIQASIDGLRLVAQRNQDYAGQDEPIFEGGEKFPTLAKVTVYKFSPKGERYPAAVGVAYWSEYKPAAGQDFMWTKMPHTMLSKVAEALALRKAFPQELSGLYTIEEMEQAGGEVKEIVVEGEPVKESEEKIIREKVEEEQPATVAHEVTKPENEDACSECGRDITPKVRDYSNSKYGRPLCYNCQKHATA